MTTKTLPNPNAIQELSNRIWQAAAQRAQQTPTLPAIHQPRLRLRLIQIAYEDAAYMATLFIAGQSISRHSCHSVNIKEMRWLRARALLKLAGLTEENETGLNTNDLDQIKQRMEGAYRTAIATPSLFFAHMPTPKPRVRKPSK